MVVVATDAEGPAESVGLCAHEAVVAVDDTPEPAPAADRAGTAQALVPASRETPTAAATIRPAAAGAIRRSTARPWRPALPGRLPAIAASHTTATQVSKIQTSTPATTRTAASTAEPIDGETAERDAPSLSSEPQLAGPGTTSASPTSATRHVANCARAERADDAGVGIEARSGSIELQSVHLNLFAM